MGLLIKNSGDENYLSVCLSFFSRQCNKISINFDDLVKSPNLDGFVKCSRLRHETGDPLAGCLPLEQTKS